MTDADSGGGHDRCGADTPDGACRLPAGWGTDHKGYGRCRKHAGSTPTHRRAAQREQAVIEARKLAPHLERDEDPAEVLLAELRTARAMAAHFEDMIASGQAPIVGSGIGGSEVVSPYAELWQRERDRAVGIATTCLRLGLEARRVAQAERMGDAIFLAVTASLKAAGLDPADPSMVAAARQGVEVFERALGPGDESG